MARKYASTGSVETIRKRLGRTLSQFSEDLGFGLSAYGDMVRNDKVTENAALAAEALMRRQAPGAASELTYLTRIVRGIPHITVLDGDLREMTLDGECFLLIPKEQPRPRPPVREAHAGNGAASTPAADTGRPEELGLTA
jgi:hypothetical protein